MHLRGLKPVAGRIPMTLEVRKEQTRGQGDSPTSDPGRGRSAPEV